jgi:hypothetical protein
MARPSTQLRDFQVQPYLCSQLFHRLWILNMKTYNHSCQTRCQFNVSCLHLFLTHQVKSRWYTFKGSQTLLSLLQIQLYPKAKWWWCRFIRWPMQYSQPILSGQSVYPTSIRIIQWKQPELT